MNLYMKMCLLYDIVPVFYSLQIKLVYFILYAASSSTNLLKVIPIVTTRSPLPHILIQQSVSKLLLTN